MTTAELDELITELGRRHFVNHEMRIDRYGPDVVGFVRDWGNTADVVILFDDKKACAWRTVTGPGTDLFAPELVSWWYKQSPLWTLRAMLTMPPPGHPDEPRQIMPLPPGCALPEGNRMAMRVRMRPRYEK